MTVPEIVGKTAQEIFSKIVPRTRKVGNVPLSADIPVSVTGDTAITVTNTGAASAIGYSIAHKDSGVTAGSKGDMTNQTPGFGGTFKVLSATVDAKGHVTVLEEHSVKIPDSEATQTAKGLMSAADKTKLDTLIDATLSMAGKAADAKVAGDKIAALESENAIFREYFSNMEAYRTASGNPATFHDGYAANVKALSVTITPTQAGSGDPSPDNVRPISGVSSVLVTRTGENGANPQTVTVQLTDGSDPLTVYGGTLDVTTGELTVTKAVVNLGSISWVIGSSGGYFQTAALGTVVKRPSSISIAADALCSHYPVVTLSDAYYNAVSAGIAVHTTGYVVIRDRSKADYSASDFSATLSGVTFVYPLATPITYNLTPQQLATLSGYNAVTTDAGTLSVTYRADPILSRGGV